MLSQNAKFTNIDQLILQKVLNLQIANARSEIYRANHARNWYNINKFICGLLGKSISMYTIQNHKKKVNSSKKQ